MAQYEKNKVENSSRGKFGNYGPHINYWRMTSW